MSFHDTGNVELCANCDLFAANLAVITTLIADAFDFYLMENALTGGVVVKAVQRVLTRMKPAFAKLRASLLIGLAFLKLEATALHVLVKTLVRFHLRCSPFCGIIQVNFVERVPTV